MREFLDKKKKVVCARRLRVSLVRLIIAGARNACNGKHYLPPSCVNYVGQDGNAVLPPFEKTRPVNVRVGREKRERKNKQTNKTEISKKQSSSSCSVWLKRITTCLLWSQGEEKMDITDQGAQMEPLLPTVRPNTRAIVVFVFNFMSWSL